MAKAATVVDPKMGIATVNAPSPEPEKSVMLDDRKEHERLADIRRVNLNMLEVFQDRISIGKEANFHPRVITDQAFLIEYIDKLERKLATYKKREPVADED